MIPRKTLIRVGGYVNRADIWVKRFDEQGLNATLKRGKKAALVSFKPSEFSEFADLLREFLCEATGVSEIPADSES